MSRQPGMPSRYRQRPPTNAPLPISSDGYDMPDDREASERFYTSSIPSAHGRMPVPAPPPHRYSPPSPTHYQHPPPHRYPAATDGEISGPTYLDDSPPRDTGSHALRDIDDLYGGRMMSPSPEPDEQAYSSPAPLDLQAMSRMPPRRPLHQPADSQSSVAPLMVPREPSPLRQAPSPYQLNHVPSQMSHGHAYQSDGYDGYVNPNDIADDGDDGLEEAPRQHQSSGASEPVSRGLGGAAAAGGVAGMFKAFGKRDNSGNYGHVPADTRAGGDPEKSDWLQKQSSGSKRMKWIVGSVIAVILLAAIVGGVVGGILGSKKSSSSGGGSSSSSTSSNGGNSNGGLYDINSSQVKALLNNPNLHRVFPGMDYTPLNAQYPGCLTVPPDQNNITLDIAMLAQLTPAVRLYGTDCNQTEMVLAAIDRLGYNDTTKVWLGVWLENNATTNNRQLQQMYDILDNYPSSHFAGVIVGNEVLFREDMTLTQLADQLQEVRQNLSAKSINLPVSTSDLGVDWTAALAADSDIVMSNVHPFFAGVTPVEAPGWTWDFWQTTDAVLKGTGTASGGWPKNIISETGWPSAGGNDCGTNNACPNPTAGAVANIDNMNAFMDGWVCQSLTNGTTYFWFEAFDEPWKVIYNTPTDGWETKWGLMDANRNLKDGLKVPDCGGQTVDKPY